MLHCYYSIISQLLEQQRTSTHSHLPIAASIWSVTGFQTSLQIVLHVVGFSKSQLDVDLKCRTRGCNLVSIFSRKSPPVPSSFPFYVSSVCPTCEYTFHILSSLLHRLLTRRIVHSYSTTTFGLAFPYPTQLQLCSTSNAYSTQCLHSRPKSWRWCATVIYAPSHFGRLLWLYLPSQCKNCYYVFIIIRRTRRKWTRYRELLAGTTEPRRCTKRVLSWDQRGWKSHFWRSQSYLRQNKFQSTNSL